ncbi:hypothetical protein K503DRAFT_870886 [Rhizopogon vinicolor AM-OR11-026]|uniref:Uncharacterized protein n=1 Tax=Rhizopogon vinicolor AM-OR11-026 TaxID=1314800 RepID=A0A1B7MDV6_9AGAM|nr:hypothetical protein K503DRAFT_870886 [Rhizopogon vinicolor AM-OR11-026]
MEAIGDITASAEVSRLRVEGEEFDSRIQGGILSDGIGGFVSALFTVTPLSIFSQFDNFLLYRCAWSHLVWVDGVVSSSSSSVHSESFPGSSSQGRNVYIALGHAEVSGRVT